MSSLNCSLLVHTFNRYEKYWDGYLKGFSENFLTNMPCYFGTDTKNHTSHDFHDMKVIYSGVGEWSDRLTALLTQIKTKYVLYMQEDQWPTSHPPDIERIMQIMRLRGLWRLQLGPVVQFYSLYGDKIPLFFHQKSKYLVSHQPSIWRKDFLLSCLHRNEDPWKNEYEGTKRLNNTPEIQGKIAIYPCNWYTHECTTGNPNKK